MKSLTLTLLAFLATAVLSAFVPVSNYSLDQIEGTWYVQSIYNTLGASLDQAYCFQLNFKIVNQSFVNMTMIWFDGRHNKVETEVLPLHPNPKNPAILDQDRVDAPLIVVDVKTTPSWTGGNLTTSIFAVNSSKYSSDAYVVFGASKSYDTRVDIRPFLQSQKLPFENTEDFWFINTACDAHFGWKSVKTFDAKSLLKKWNLLAVYEPAGSNLVPWYTKGGLYDWTNAYCAKVSFQNGKGSGYQMSLTLKSLYQGDFNRTWLVSAPPELNSVLLGFNINENTLLYVQYADQVGNLILTAGTTTSFFLSTSSNTLTPTLRTLFTANLKNMGYAKVNTDLIVPIDNNSC